MRRCSASRCQLCFCCSAAVRASSNGLARVPGRTTHVGKSLRPSSITPTLSVACRAASQVYVSPRPCLTVVSVPIVGVPIAPPIPRPAACISRFERDLGLLKRDSHGAESAMPRSIGARLEREGAVDRICKGCPARGATNSLTGALSPLTPRAVFCKCGEPDRARYVLSNLCSAL